MDMVQGAKLITLHANWETATAHLRKALASAGIDVVCTFDLQVARTEDSDQICPLHGTAHCDGQMVVLLVYEGDNPPLTLEVHGHNGLARFAIVEIPEKPPDAHLVATILQELKGISTSKQNQEGVNNIG